MDSWGMRNIFTAEELELHRMAIHYVGLVDHIDPLGREVRCHELARALHLRLGSDRLAVRDGKRGPVEHSWLLYSRQTRLAILDPYAPGVAPQVLWVDSLMAEGYHHGAVRSDVRADVVDHLLAMMQRG